MSLKETLEKINSNLFSIEIFGLGYVGFPLAVRLANNGINVIGIDINQERIQRLQKNSLLDSELFLKEEFLLCRNNNMLKLSDQPEDSTNPKVGIICVPTPIPDKNTSSDVFVQTAVENFLKFSKEGDVIILESSVEVGTTKKISEIIKSKGFIVGENFGVSFCPERIDPSNKEWGIENIPRVIYCSDDITNSIAKIIYDNVNGGNLIRVSSPEIAEIVKSFENAFRLVNISLVNELAMLCDRLEINVKEVIDAAATKPFGFLPHYPGAGAGGHCIPKDPRFLVEAARKFDVDFSTIQDALRINEKMPSHVIDLTIDAFKESGKSLNNSEILILGISYKPDVKDIQLTPAENIIKKLKSLGANVHIYDPYFSSTKIFDIDVRESLSDKLLEKMDATIIVTAHEEFKKITLSNFSKMKTPILIDSRGIIDPIDAKDSMLIFRGLGRGK